MQSSLMQFKLMDLKTRPGKWERAFLHSSLFLWSELGAFRNNKKPSTDVGVLKMINSLRTPQFFAADENLYDLFFVVVESPQGSKLNESFKLGGRWRPQEDSPMTLPTLNLKVMNNWWRQDAFVMKFMTLCLRSICFCAESSFRVLSIVSEYQ